MKREILHATYKKLVLTIKSLSVEYKQTQELFDMIRSEFASAFTQYCMEQDPEFLDKANQFVENQAKEKREQSKAQESKTEYTGSDYTKRDEETPDEDVAPKKDDTPPEVKKLYRKIVMVSHPDRNEGIDDEEKDRLTDLYKEATKAYDKNDMSTLIRIAVELKLETPDPSEDQLKSLENKVIELKMDITRLEQTVAWNWFYGTDEEREFLFQKHYDYVRSKHE